MVLNDLCHYTLSCSRPTCGTHRLVRLFLPTGTTTPLDLSLRGFTHYFSKEIVDYHRKENTYQCNKRSDILFVLKKGFVMAFTTDEVTTPQDGRNRLLNCPKGRET